MLLIIGYIIVLAATLGGFMMAGGHPGVLMHASEFVIIGGIAIGILVIASPKAILMGTVSKIMESLKNSGVSQDEYLDLLKLLYEMFMLGRRNGLIALDEHVSDPAASSLISKYPSFAGDPQRVEFLCNSLRPLIDGKVKPEQLESMLQTEIHNMEDEAEGPLNVLNLVGDSLPGVGIVAAVLGIINTMGSIAEGPEKVGYKVAAALTGTFLGILGAYGFINPLHRRIAFMCEGNVKYYSVIATAISGFAKGLAPIMSIEIARRSLDRDARPDADTLETTLKSLNKAS